MECKAYNTVYKCFTRDQRDTGPLRQLRLTFFFRAWEKQHVLQPSDSINDLVPVLYPDIWLQD